ncbi:MAG TPA: MFS transporter [Phycisphaerae bacterium]|nr:MFS transporter [Phycisphaerae bacterium]
MGTGSATTSTRSPTCEKPLRRGRALLLAESPLATTLGMTLSGTFLTAMVVGFEGGVFEVGLATAAGALGAVGMLVSNPLINRIGSRRRFCLITLGVVRSLRMVISGLPLLVIVGWAPRSMYWPLVGCVLVSAMFGTAAEISRRSWISDLVGPTERGRFFSRRVMLSMLASIIILPTGGMLLDRMPRTGGQPMTALAVLVGFGAAVGWVGWLLLYRAPEPPMAPPRRQTGLGQSLILPWLRPRFRPLLAVAGANALACSLAAGFFDIYMLRHLGLSWKWIAAVNTVGQLAALAAAPLFGRWADHSGARKVLNTSFWCKGIFPALWILVAPAWWQLVFVVVLVRAFNSAGMICWARLSMNLSPPRNRAAFLAASQAIVGAGGAVGALAGGTLVALLDRWDFSLDLGGFAVVPLHVVFLLSAVMRVTTIPLLRYIREPRHSMVNAPDPDLD